METGTGTSNSSAQGSSSTDVAGDNLSHHQARVRAAAAAASIYEKSYVYPFASTLAWYALSLSLKGLGVEEGSNYKKTCGPCLILLFVGLENLLQY